MSIMENYMGNYYNNRLGFRNVSDPSARNNSVISDNFQTRMGYSLTDLNRRYYFEEIAIQQYGMQGSVDRITQLINPVITNFSVEVLDYSDSQPALFNITFQPEYVVVNSQGSTNVGNQSINTPNQSINTPTAPNQSFILPNAAFSPLTEG
jgi:hypothetical protein